jgi:hypothetical protein
LTLSQGNQNKQSNQEEQADLFRQRARQQSGTRRGRASSPGSHLVVNQQRQQLDNSNVVYDLDFEIEEDHKI